MDEANNQIFVNREGDVNPSGTPGKIQKLILGATDVTDLATLGNGSVEGFAINNTEQALYWTTFNKDVIDKINFDGSSQQIAVEPLNYGLSNYDVGIWSSFQFFDAPSATTTQIPALNFSITPNPTNGDFKLNTPKDFHSGLLKVFTSSGVLINQYTIMETEFLQLNNLENGIYLLEITDIISGHSGIQKLMISK